MYILETINMSEDEKIWLESVCVRMKQATRQQKVNPNKAVDKIFQTPNVISALQLSKFTNINEIENIIEDSNSLIQIFKETVNNFRFQSAPSFKPDDHIFAKCRISEKIKTKITKENAEKICKTLPLVSDIPQYKTMYTVRNEIYYCTHVKCTKSVKTKKGIIRRAITNHFHPNHFVCTKCKHTFSRYPLFQKHAIKVHQFF